MHEQAFQYFEGIPHELVYDQDSLYPRYIRDQLQIIHKAIKEMDTTTLDKALEAMKRKLYNASEFSDVITYIKRYRQVNSEQSSTKDDIKTLYDTNQSIISSKPTTREFDEYLAILEGGRV